MLEKTIGFFRKNRGVMFLAIGLLIGLTLILLDSRKNEKRIPDESAYEYSIEKYAESTEQKLEDLINRIDGVSGAEVLISLKSGSEYIYASDDSETSEKHVVVDNGLVYVKQYLPEIEGVAVVCRGGSDVVLKQKITELICSLLGIRSNHVCVTE